MSRCSIKSKEFKQRLNQRLYERELEQRLQEEQRQRDKKLEDEKRKFQETVESLKYDWRKEMYPELPPQEPVKVVKERRVKVPDHLKYDWRKEINEGMTSSGVFLTNLPATGDTNLQTIDSGNEQSFNSEFTSGIDFESDGFNLGQS
jgi:hypothetical protein